MLPFRNCDTLMKQKAAIPASLLDKRKASALIETWFEIVHLKQLFRQGWIKRGMASGDCETVAEHTFGNAMLCLLLLPDRPELDGHKALRLALVHDIGEVHVGDITPQDKIPRAEKIRRETAAIHQIFGKLPGGEQLIDDWLEYESQSTPEARFVKEIDRLELAMQASVYQLQGKVNAEEFLNAAEQHVTSATLVEHLAGLRALGLPTKGE
ncbi:MAG: HD domain-containing protein [Pseudomonadota bacterium]